MKKIIKPGQLVTFENAIYKAKKCLDPIEACSKCDLYKNVHMNLILSVVYMYILNV